MLAAPEAVATHAQLCPLKVHIPIVPLDNEALCQRYILCALFCRCYFLITSSIRAFFQKWSPACTLASGSRLLRALHGRCGFPGRSGGSCSCSGGGGGRLAGRRRLGGIFRQERCTSFVFNGRGNWSLCRSECKSYHLSLALNFNLFDLPHAPCMANTNLSHTSSCQVPWPCRQDRHRWI